MILQNSTDVKVQLFYDENNDIAPMDIRYEKHIINPNGLIQLQNLPSPLHTVFDVRSKDGVTVIKYNKVEVISNKYDFTVDYENGILTFHSSQANKEIVVSYTNSIGRLCISAERIFTTIDNQGNVVGKLNTIIEEGQQVLSDLEVLGGAVKVITELEGYLESIKELTGNILEGNNVNDKLVKSTNTAKSTNISLDNTIKNANTTMGEMNEWVETHSDITNLDNRVDSVETNKQNKTDNSLLTTVKNLVGAINEIYNGIKTEIVSRRVRGQNTSDSPAGTFDFANFAGQGKTSNIPIGGIVHHYTDGKTIQIDNVGQGNVIMTIVNANNPTRRPDKPSTFYGSGYYLQLMTNNPNTNEVYSHLVIDEKANLFWNGISPNGGVNVPTLTSAKDDNGYPAFLIKSSKNHQTLIRFENGNGIAQLLLNKTGNRSDIISPSEIVDGLQLESKSGGIRLAPANGNVDLVNANIRKVYNGLWYKVYPDLFGTTANRPTDIAGQFGMPYFDMTLNKMIYVNNLGTGWVDAMGNPV